MYASKCLFIFIWYFFYFNYWCIWGHIYFLSHFLHLLLFNFFYSNFYFVNFGSSPCPTKTYSWQQEHNLFHVSSSSSPLHPHLYLLWVFWGEQNDFFGGITSSPHVCYVSLLQLLPHLAFPLHSHQEAAPPCPRRGLRPHLLDTNAPCLTHPARSLTVHTVKGA